MKSFGKIASSLAIAALVAAPVAAAVPEAGTTLSRAAVKAIGTKMRSGVVVRLNKKVARKNGVELAQVEGADSGTGASAGGAGGAGGSFGGLGVAGAVAGVAAGVGVAVAASSGGGSNSP